MLFFYLNGWLIECQLKFQYASYLITFRLQIFKIPCENRYSLSISQYLGVERNIKKENLF